MNSYIDYANLDKNATLRDIENLCDEAMQKHYASVYVYPYYIALAHNLLKNSTVQVATVINGLNTKAVKVYEAIDAIENGADEIDLSINISAVKNKDYDYVKEEIEEVRDAIDGKTITLLIDSNLLTKEEIIKVVEICNETYINFIKINNSNIDIINLINNHKNEILEISVRNTNPKEDIDKLISFGVSRIEITQNNKYSSNKTCECGCMQGNECNCEGDCHCEECKCTKDGCE